MRSLAAPAPGSAWRLGWPAVWLALLVAMALWPAVLDAKHWAVVWPKPWIVPVKAWLTAAMGWLRDGLSFGLFTFQDLTRGLSWLLAQPLHLATSLLATGFLSGTGQQAVRLWPALPWIAVVGIPVLLALRLGDRRLALLVGACFAYLALFGQWASAMVTLASIAVAVPLGVAGGMALGIWAFRRPLVERLLTPLLDLMQTVPIFAYLVPILWFFGFSPVAAMIGTVIYALPAMVRNTTLALRRVPVELVEYGSMAGCTPWQLLWKVQLPSARAGLMLGVNQVIMLSLNMVIIASMIGAGGLGFDVLTALRRLDIGAGLQASIAITLLAIALDRLSQAASVRDAAPARPYLVGAAALVLGGWIAGLALPAVQAWPDAWTLTTGTALGDAIGWLNLHLFDTIEAVKAWLLVNLMVPLKRFLQGLPWLGVVLGLAIAGWQLDGWRLAATVTALALFVAVTGQWDLAMVSLYLCGLGVLLSCLIGIPLGIWSARSRRAAAVIQPAIDTLQTIPAFAYLIPAVMLLRVGDFAALLAIVAYAVVPAVRYTAHGIAHVDPHVVEAGRAMGSTPGQLLRKIQLPLALPEILLGINQTVMFALAMLVITALVGTRDLGQEVYVALAKADIGRGLVAGFCVAAIAIIADRLLRAGSRRLETRLGLA
ncbi:MAG TPA: ABC transporter permease subunit [Geminicoccaceae bacterium]|nr:ABC transporter permease subunit [Geminicoccus sp.]HMU51519.1 ABC transporter permease subunit [Geminicoccaceae bacterium]